MNSDYYDSEEGDQKGHVRLKQGINMKELFTGETFEINFDDLKTDEEAYDPKKVHLSTLSGAGLGLDSDDDDDDLNSTPFEKRAVKMIDVTEDGKIKKRIKREGTGELPPENALVSIRYSSYLEYNDEPTDSAYIKKPYQFRLGNAGIFGLNTAVMSMKVNEKSWFLIHHDYAFGEMGHPPRIPPCATFLFHVELLRFVDSGPAKEMYNLSIKDKSQFPIAYKTALSLIETGKEYIRIGNIKLAIREYNRSVCLLCDCNLMDMSEQEKQQKLLLKLYTNLAICYNKDSNPKKACCMCNNIYAMTKNTSLIIPAKVYFNNGRALFMLNDYQRAREKLLKAKKLEPQNKEICMELAKISAKMQEEAERERAFARILLQNNNHVPQEFEAPSNVDVNFINVIRSQCEELISNDQVQFKLPGGLTDEERQAAKFEAEKIGLKLRESKHNENDGKLAYFITKV